MITISLCMIVKNEEPVLARCLDSVASMMDEIIIVDTGSTDRTKEIAAQYTNRIYDFTWCDDFSAARNYAFSLATMDYIYCPDADEYLDLENQRRFLRLKGTLLPEIEIVQMNYITPPDFNTVQNCKKEPRPKLFKRLRTFSWVDPVHETIRTDPVIYDSDIDILHRPHVMHAKRDFAMFEKAFRENRVLSEKITRMYARELYKCGDEEDFLRAADYFSLHYEAHADAESACILAHASRIQILWMILFDLSERYGAVLPAPKSVMSSDNTTGNGRIPRKLLCGFIMLHLRHSLFWILKFQGKKHCFNWRNVTVRWQKMNSVIHALPGIFSPVLRNMNNRHRRGNCRKNYNLRKNHL